MTAEIAAWALGGGAGVAMVAALLFAYEAIRARSDEVDTLHAQMAELDARRTAEADRDALKANLVAVTADRDALRSALAAANQTATGDIAADAARVKEQIDAATGASLLGVVSGELSTPLPGVPGAAPAGGGGNPTVAADPVRPAAATESGRPG